MAKSPPENTENGKPPATKKPAKKKATAARKKPVKIKKTAVKAKPKASKKAATAGKQAGAISSIMAVTAEERWKMIAVAAYFKAQARGFEPGHEEDDWLEAESDIDAFLR